MNNHKKSNYLADLILRIARLATYAGAAIFILTGQDWKKIAAVILLSACLILLEGVLIKKFGR